MVKDSGNGKVQPEAGFATKVKEEIVHLNLPDDVKKTLECTLIGECKNFLFLGSLNESFEEGWGDLKLEFLGGLAVCILFNLRRVRIKPGRVELLVQVSKQTEG